MTFKEITAKNLFAELISRLSPDGDLDEQKNKIYWLLEDRLDLTRTAVITDQPVVLKNNEWQQLETDIEKINAGYPVQHIIGKAWFYGREFKVNRNVLIPRPETEELVDLIIKENNSANVNILDIGTGSGCIPITLKLELPASHVWGMDISADALEVAEENSREHQADIILVKKDVFDEPDGFPVMDILVSNPPYVPESEMENMQKEVLNHEPHIALFVKDADPLIFYRRIAEIGQSILSGNGRLYFEIHYTSGEPTVKLLRSFGYRNINVIRDIHNKDRIVTAIR